MKTIQGLLIIVLCFLSYFDFLKVFMSSNCCFWWGIVIKFHFEYSAVLSKLMNFWNHQKTSGQLIRSNPLNIGNGICRRSLLCFYFREFRKYSNDVDIGIKPGRGLNPPNVSLKEILKTEGFMISFYRSSHRRCSVKKRCS